MTNAQIAESMSVYVIWVKKLQFRYRNYTSNPSESSKQLVPFCPVDIAVIDVVEPNKEPILI